MTLPIQASNNGYYKDFAEIINESGVANDAIAVSSWFDGYYWGRKFLMKVKAGGAYDVIIYRKNANDITDWSTEVIDSAVTGDTSGSYASIEFDTVAGYSFRIGLVNRSGGAIDLEGHLELFKN